MKEELFNNETKRKAGQQGREESQHPVYQRQPRQLGLYDVENEHDACGVGMLVNIHGGKSHELVVCIEGVGEHASPGRRRCR